MPLISRYLLSVKGLDEFAEVVPSVVRSRRGLRMVLHTERGEVLVPYTFHRVIIEVTVCDLKLFGT